MLKALIFDLDQTLIDRNATFDLYLGAQFDALGFAQAGLRLSDYKAFVYEWDDNGYRDKREVFAKALAHFALPNTQGDLMAHFLANYGRNPVVFEGVLEALARWQTKLPMALMTNGLTQTQQAKVNAAGLNPYFEQVFISQTEGLKKPNPELYLRAANAFGVDPSECAFIGDHPVNDVEAPKQLGMTAIWIRTPTYSPPAFCDFELDSVLSLPDVLPELQ